jgi:hypothetical protein
MDDFRDIFGESPLVWWILAAEVAFWVLLIGGLVVRYLVKARRLSTILLLAVPLVDLALLVLTALDVASGVEPNFSHVLATLYLGITVAFGHAIIARADGWFAWRFAGAARPARPPRRGPGQVRRLWVEWFRVVLAWFISSTGIAMLALVSSTPPPTSVEAVWDAPLWSVVARFTAVVGIWLIAGPLYASLFEASGEPTARDHGSEAEAARRHSGPPNGA